MTPKQWHLLETLEQWDGHGTMEVLLAFDREPEDDSEAAAQRAWNLTKFVVAGMVRVLVKKGLATNDENGYGITEKGRELLAKKKKREAPTFERAWKATPAEVDTDPLAMKTIDDLRCACQIQLDLIEEGQDSAEGLDPKPIRKWLKKYGRPEGVK